MLLITVRHGETEWNVSGREMGHLDSPLTALGRSQAEAIARRLSALSIDALYSSDLGRAAATAHTVGSMCGVAPQLDPGLRERHMGVLQGLGSREIRERFPAVRESYERLGYYPEIPGGEGIDERTKRGVRAFTAIAKSHPGQRVVAVTHGGLLTGFFEHVMGLGHGNGARFRKAHGSYNAFGYEDGRWFLVTWNDTSHLEQVSSDGSPTVQANQG
jgi:probable phosphoglycerate mutase